MKKKKIKRIIIIILIIYYKKLYTYIHQNIMRKGGSEVTNINRKSDHRCRRAVPIFDVIRLRRNIKLQRTPNCIYQDDIYVVQFVLISVDELHFVAARRGGPCRAGHGRGDPSGEGAFKGDVVESDSHA